MKGKTLSALGIIMAAIGAVLILCFKSITNSGIVITGGCLFMGVGIINLIVYGQNAKDGHALGHALGQIANAAAIVLGICMLVFESTFAPLVPFIFGLLISVCALWEFFLLAIGTRPHILPGWLYVFPLLLVGAAVYIFLQKEADEHLIMLITGISLAVLGIGCIIQGSMLGVARRASIKAEAQKHDLEVNSHPSLAQKEGKENDNAEKTKRHSETTEDLDDPSELPPEDPKTEK